jgi:hypothetical protein
MYIQKLNNKCIYHYTMLVDIIHNPYVYIIIGMLIVLIGNKLVDVVVDGMFDKL